MWIWHWKGSHVLLPRSETSVAFSAGAWSCNAGALARGFELCATRAASYTTHLGTDVIGQKNENHRRKTDAVSRAGAPVLHVLRRRPAQGRFWLEWGVHSISIDACHRATLAV
jgi:hypothetical protein